MYICSITNARNDRLRLTQDESNFQLLNIEGLNPPTAQINSSAVATLDGAKFNSAKLNARNIVLYIKVGGSVEKNRLRLYSFFVTKEKCRITYRNGSVNVFADGYVENIEYSAFSEDGIMQVSVICLDPYLKSVREMLDDISKDVKLFEFPFSITAEGTEFSRYNAERIADVKSIGETGVTIEIGIHALVEHIKIVMPERNEFFALRYRFFNGDKVTINTNKGEKSVYLERNREQTNLFTAMEQGSTFFQLKAGSNEFSYEVDGGENDSEVSIVFKHRDLYRGV